VCLDLSNHTKRLRMQTVIAVEDARAGMMVVSLCPTF
jgi:hypothetical protein